MKLSGSEVVISSINLRYLDTVILLILCQLLCIWIVYDSCSVAWASDVENVNYDLSTFKVLCILPFYSLSGQITSTFARVHLKEIL